MNDEYGDGSDPADRKRWAVAARKAAALTQAQLAEKLDVSSGRVAQWESPRIATAVPNVKRLAEICLMMGWLRRAA
jgi:transcriptional regulator with XRE-family HTH domain